MTEEFRRDRIGIGILSHSEGVEILPQDWTSALSRITAVERVASSLNPYPLGLGGSRWISPQSHGLGGTRQSFALAPKELVWSPIFTSVSFNTMAMCVEVTAANSVGKLRLGLYDANRALIADFGECDASTTGWKVLEISTPATVTPGMSLLAVQANNIAGMEIRQLTGGLAMYHSGSTLMVPVHGIRTLDLNYGPMPATAPLGAAATSIPLLGLRLD